MSMHFKQFQPLRISFFFSFIFNFYFFPDSAGVKGHSFSSAFCTKGIPGFRRCRQPSGDSGRVHLNVMNTRKGRAKRKEGKREEL